MGQPKKRPRLDPDASLEAGSSRRSDMTSISLQQLRDLIRSPTINVNSLVCQEMISAALRQAKEEVQMLLNSTPDSSITSQKTDLDHAPLSLVPDS